MTSRFRYRDPAPLRPTPATLKRVALARLSAVEFFSASLGGESFVFAPWLTTLIDRGSTMRFVGVYRTDSTRWLCVRRSEWIRAADIKRARRARDFGAYLASGSQIADSFVFAQDRPELIVATRRLLSELAKGITIAATEPRRVAWQQVSVEVADDRFVTSVDYSPLTARSDVLEARLAPWLEVAEDAVAQGGTRPDGEIALSIRRSVPEIVGAPRAARP